MFHVETTVRLTGVTVSQFTTAVESHFISVIGTKLEITDTGYITVLKRTAVGRRRRRQLLASSVDVKFDVAVLDETRALWVSTTLKNWVPDTSVTGFISMLNAEISSAVTISSASVSVESAISLIGTAAPASAPSSDNDSGLSTAALVLAILGVVALVIVVIIVIVIVVLMLVVMAKTKADFARAVDGATKGTQNVELRKMPPPE
jgi:hypothetical protein